MNLSTLNEQQRKAVQSTEGPLLITAGPGTGKTSTLTHRIAFLIKERNISPKNILAVTFTNKAAEEMKKRVVKMIGIEGHNSFYIGTFHYICTQILKDEIHRLGWNRDFLIYDSTDQINILNDLLSETPFKDNPLSPVDASSMISDVKNMIISIDEHQNLKEIFHSYQESLKVNNALDLDDLILKTIEIFEAFPEVLAGYRNRFRYIMVDEYQDINKPQYRLIHLLSGSHKKNLCVIGDADQAIYSFRGANIQNFLEFKKDYPDANVIKLEQNYRSTKTVIDASHRVISQNKDRLDTKLYTNISGTGDKIKLLTVYDEKDEAKQIVREIEREMGGTTMSGMDITRDGVSSRAESRCFSDFAVLYRIHGQSRAIEDAFIRSGIPYQIVGGLRFYDRKEIKDILAYLRLINNTKDNVSLLRIINTPPRHIGEQTLTWLKSCGKSAGRAYFEILCGMDRFSGLSQTQKDTVERFTTLVAGLKSIADKCTVDELIRCIVRETNMESYYNDGTDKGIKRIENITTLISSTIRFKGFSPRESLLAFLEEASLMSRADTYDPRAKVVTIMTLHAAKGLEFPVVFICGVEMGLIPYNKYSGNEEEERRLLYVGMTRAKKRLYLLHTKRRFLFGQTYENPLSPFLSEIPSGLLDKVDYSSLYRPKKKRNPQMGLFD